MIEDGSFLCLRCHLSRTEMTILSRSIGDDTRNSGSRFIHGAIRRIRSFDPRDRGRAGAYTRCRFHWAEKAARAPSVGKMGTGRSRMWRDTVTSSARNSERARSSEMITRDRPQCPFSFRGRVYVARER